MIAKPLIGIPLGNKETSFSRLPHYAMEKNYFDAISELGGLPIPIPYNEKNYESYIDMVDGLLIPGGSFASPRTWYEDENIELVEANDWSDFFAKITKTAIDRKIPILGICAGMQFMAGVTDGKMTVNITNKLGSEIDHLNGAPKEERYHKINVDKSSLLYKIIGTENFSVNSAHTEAVVAVSNNTQVCATAEDGCIEAIELLNHPFAIGVQWHPEFFCDDPETPDYKIMKALIDAAKTNRI